ELQGLIDHGDQPQCDIVDSQLLVTRPQGAVLLVPADHPLDDVPPPIPRLIEVLGAPLVLPRRDDLLDPPPPTPAADARIAVTLVPRQVARPTAPTTAAGEQLSGHRRLERLTLVRLPGRDMDRQDEPAAVTDQIDLRPEPAAR